MEYQFIAKEEVLQAIVDGYRVVYIGFVSNVSPVYVKDWTTLSVDQINKKLLESDNKDIFAKIREAKNEEESGEVKEETENEE